MNSFVILGFMSLCDYYQTACSSHGDFLFYMYIFFNTHGSDRFGFDLLQPYKSNH